MSQPSVCAVMLTANRPEYARRAVECFRKQTYHEKHLLVYGSGTEFGYLREEFHGQVSVGFGRPVQTIGAMRNYANTETISSWDILIHWDDDDYSHPSRIVEQVALLQSSGADCVGYSDLLFWREPGTQTGIASGCRKCGYTPCLCPGEAWFYTSPGPKPSPPGTTLCYTRKSWERNPFPATSIGEDERFVRTCGKVVCISSLPCPGKDYPNFGTSPQADAPRMIARIHPGNTSTAYDPRKMAAESKKKNPAWQRVPAWDSYCAGVMR